MRGHQEFAANGVAQIEPAWQMERLYGDCRHYITYSGPDSASTWNTVAYFGGRYVLTMQVPVAIKSSHSGKMIGEARFYLNEVSAVTIYRSGQVGARFSRNFDFGAAEWGKVFASGGDLGEIGFKAKTGPPVDNFEKFAAASR